MARYIDADKLAKTYMMKGKDKLRIATVINELELAPTADVVPKSEVEKLKVINKLLEQDIADRDEMLESKVEEVYADFMRDYKCMREELDGLYDEYSNIKSEVAREIFEEIEKVILDNTYPDFNAKHKPVNVWKATTGYDAFYELKKKYTGEKK